MTKSEAQAIDKGAVFCKPLFGGYQVIGEKSGFLYAQFNGPNCGRECLQYADDEYNSWTVDGEFVGQ